MTGLRGSGCDVAEIEEAAHCDPRLLSKHISALQTMAHVPVLAISTPDDEMNYYSKLPEIKHPITGKPLFKVIKIGLSCDACAEKNIKCVHKKAHIPIWKSGERQLIAEALIDSDEATKKQEIHGTIANSGDTVYCFSQGWIKNLCTRPPWIFQRPVQVIHVGVDPSGGGAESEFAIGSVAFDGPHTIVRSQHQIIRPHRIHEIRHRVHRQRQGVVLLVAPAVDGL
jgi:hypothetical protein